MTGPQTFTKRPVVIQAMQFTGGWDNGAEIANWIGDTHVVLRGENHLVIPTLEGDMRAQVGDWIIRGIKGEFYPCKPEIFEMTYQRGE